MIYLQDPNQAGSVSLKVPEIVKGFALGEFLGYPVKKITLYNTSCLGLVWLAAAESCGEAQKVHALVEVVPLQ